MNAEIEKWDLLQRLDRLEEGSARLADTLFNFQESTVTHLASMASATLEAQKQHIATVVRLFNAIPRDPRHDPSLAVYNASAYCRGMGTTWEAFRSENADHIKILIESGNKIEEHDGDFYVSQATFWHHPDDVGWPANAATIR